MFHLDNSEVSWLVYTDWLEDQGRDSQHIRDILNETPRHWCYEQLWDYNGVGNTAPDLKMNSETIFGQSVGTWGDVHRVGTFYFDYVGTYNVVSMGPRCSD